MTLISPPPTLTFVLAQPLRVFYEAGENKAVRGIREERWYRHDVDGITNVTWDPNKEKDKKTPGLMF